MELHVRRGAVLCYALDAALAESSNGCNKVIASALRACAEVTALERSRVLTGLACIVLARVVAGLVARATTGLEVGCSEPLFDRVEGVFGGELHVALDVRRAGVIAALELPGYVALGGQARGEVACGPRGVVDCEDIRARLWRGHGGVTRGRQGRR